MNDAERVRLRDGLQACKDVIDHLRDRQRPALLAYASRSSPSRYSRTMYAPPSVSAPTSITVVTCSPRIRAAARASLRKRCAAPGALATCGMRTFTATSWCRIWWYAA